MKEKKGTRASGKAVGVLRDIKEKAAPMDPALKAKTTWCRSFQAAMKASNYALGYHTPRTIEGPGCVKKIPEDILAQGIDSVLLVTDKGLTELGLPNGLIAALEEAGIHYTVFDDIQPNPTDINIEEGYKAFVAGGCQGIIAFGGGSPMDCAKGIAAKHAHPSKPAASFQGLLSVHQKICPFWAVPTTAGTGSETTVAAVITEAATHHKASITDPALIPMCAVLDPELTVGLPPFITAITGMDALCHAVESYTNWTYCTNFEKNLSIKAVHLIHEYLYRAYLDGSDLEARQNMQKAAFYAGRSFTRGCVGYVHAVGHTLGGLYGIPHGLAMSVILPHVMRQFGPAVYKRLAELSLVCDIKGRSEKERAVHFIEWIEDLNEKMGIPRGFSEIRDEDIDQMIKWADKEANPLYPVPVVWGKEDFRKLIESIRL